MERQTIEASLEAVADAIGDPTGAVYARLFARAPELQEMFVLDTDGSVRGEMLSRVFETVLDLVDQDRFASGQIAAEWMNHCNLGVPADRFALLFAAMVDVFRDSLGTHWTDEFERAWQGVIARVDAVIAEKAAEA